MRESLLGLPVYEYAALFEKPHTLRRRAASHRPGDALPEARLRRLVRGRDALLRLHWAHGRYGVHGDALRLARGARGRRRETPQFVGDAAEARAAATARAVSHGEKIAGCPR